MAELTMIKHGKTNFKKLVVSVAFDAPFYLGYLVPLADVEPHT